MNDASICRKVMVSDGTNEIELFWIGEGWYGTRSVSGYHVMHYLCGSRHNRDHALEVADRTGYDSPIYVAQQVVEEWTS